MTWRSLLILIFLYSILVADDVLYHVSSDMNGSYGVEIKEIRQKNGNEVYLKIYQKNKLLISYRDKYFKELYSGDLDYDGFEEMVFQGFSGGRHCCFDIIIAQLKPNMPEPLIFDMGNAEYNSIKDLDNDKKYEITTYDDQYSNIFGLSFASSPLVKVILNFKSNKLFLNRKLMQKHIQAIDLTLQKFNISLDSYGRISIKRHTFAPLLSEILRLLYIGDNDKAMRLMKQTLFFEHRAVLKLFLIELVERLHQSPYWDDLRRFNHWQEETACFSDGCTPPEKLFEDWQIVDELFAMYYK